MNQLLQVKLRFSNESNSQRPNGRNLRVHAETSVEKIDGISQEDEKCADEYAECMMKTLH